MLFDGAADVVVCVVVVAVGVVVFDAGIAPIIEYAYQPPSTIIIMIIMVQTHPVVLMR